jgi:hypothetical protein
MEGPGKEGAEKEQNRKIGEKRGRRPMSFQLVSLSTRDHLLSSIYILCESSLVCEPVGTLKFVISR